MSGTRARAAVLAVLAVLSVLLAAGIVLTHRGAGEDRLRPSSVTGSAASGVAPRPPTGRVADAQGALRTLHRWDQARARAWGTGDVEALRGLYVEGSGAGLADVRLLRRYLARGLVVHQLRTQTLSARLVSPASAKGAGSVRLRVTERLVRAVAATSGGSQVLPRPAAPTTRVVELRQGTDNRWRVASVQ